MTALISSPQTLQLLDLVVLKEDLPDRGLHSGEVGTIVEVLDQEAYEVEFIDDEGQTLALFALRSNQLLPLSPHHYDLIQDIQVIFAELDQAYPGNPTMVGIKTLECIESNSILKKRFINALKEGGATAIEEMVDHPVAKILVAAFKGLMDA